MIKRLLALIPRPLVEVVPVRLRDAVRTQLLRLEKAVRRRPTALAAPPPVQQLPAPVIDDARLEALEHRMDGLEGQLRGVARRVEDVLTGIDQLDARVSEGASGPAPTPVDDLRAVIGPLEEISGRLAALDSAVGRGRDDDA